MDATTRWETEALRDGALPRPKPPKPSGKRSGAARNWVTLKEAEAATGIPSNTLRKWVRKSSLPSYLESDGELAIRMVDLDAVILRAHDLGREVAPVDVADGPEKTADPPTPVPTEATARRPTPDPDAAEPEIAESGSPASGTMIVPIDAWNKMLNQLGNLHDAGQQLAEARERAAKAETEAMFLRERLAELRSDPIPRPRPIADPEALEPQKVGEIAADHADHPPLAEGSEPTTTYWRYLTSGWRARRRRDVD